MVESPIHEKTWQVASIQNERCVAASTYRHTQHESSQCFVSAKKRGASSIMREKWRKKRMRRLKRKRRAQKK
ncbi:hypothetical protein V3C99_005547 [Haemonchus contortus]